MSRWQRLARRRRVRAALVGWQVVKLANYGHKRGMDLYLAPAFVTHTFRRNNQGREQAAHALACAVYDKALSDGRAVVFNVPDPA